MLGAALAAGLAASGSDVVDLGVVTTPCLVHASTDDRHAIGIMVSASHNPAPDNGLKVVVEGRKASDDIEAELDRLIDDASKIPVRSNHELGRIRTDREPVDAYTRALRDIAGEAFVGLRIAIDCANGSASAIAPGLFRSLGAEVTVLFDAPNGVNINDGCGSTHPERLAETRPDVILILPWNLAPEISRQLAYTKEWGARLAVPIPTARYLEDEGERG